jgi:hypothetical protein
MGTLHWLLWAAIVIGSRLASPAIRDLEGHLRRPFEPAGKASVLLFVTSDCPIANSYAPEIQRVCRAHAPKGVECLLLYEDLGIDETAARRHLAADRYGPMTAALDVERAIAGAALASMTPEAVVIDHAGAIRYRGRIDNSYVDLGRRRPSATVHDLRDAIDAVLAGRSVARPHTEGFGCFITPPRTGSEKPR